MAWSKRPTVSTENVPLLALDLLARIVPMRINARPPFYRAFHALAVDDRGGRTHFPLLSFATLFIERVVDSFQRAVIRPQIEVVVDRASAAGLSGSRATDSRSRECTSGRSPLPAWMPRYAHATSCPGRFNQPPRRQSNRSDIATCCGHNGRGSCSSTSVTPQIRPPLLKSQDHQIGPDSENSSDRHSDQSGVRLVGIDAVFRGGRRQRA